MVLTPPLAHLQGLMEQFRRAASACLCADAPAAALLFMLCASELLALYRAGSRRSAGQRGSRALRDFLTSYFPRFNRAAKDPKGHYFRVRIPLLREQGKAVKRLKLPTALVHLFRRGVVEDLVYLGELPQEKCVIMGQGRWGFLIQPFLFEQDFRDSMNGFLAEVKENPAVQARFMRRFNHLHGENLPNPNCSPTLDDARYLDDIMR